MQYIPIIIISFLVSINTNAQIFGTYYGQTENDVKFIKSSSLTLLSDNTYELNKTQLWIGFELPLKMITITTGDVIQTDKGIVLCPKSAETNVVHYSKNKGEINTDLTGVGINAPIPSDTIKTQVSFSKYNVEYHVYKKTNFIYLCNAESDEVFAKPIKLDEVNNIHDSISEILETHRLERALNTYDRQYRHKLNYSDSILIDKQVDSISINCTKFSDYITSQKYSGEYIKTLAEKLIDIELCPNVILDYNHYSFAHEDSLRPWELINFPIRKLLYDNDNIRHSFFSALHSQQAICSSKYLTNKSDSNSIDIDFIRIIMRQYKGYLKKSGKGKLSKCEANIIKLWEKD